MDDSSFTKDYRDSITYRPARYGKATLFENEHVLVGLNCLKPGQSMEKHAHEIQTRFYLVLEGSGLVWVGDEKAEAAEGTVLWAPPGLTHKIENTGADPMILLVGIAPAEAD